MSDEDFLKAKLAKYYQKLENSEVNLSESQWSEDGKQKSCTLCSQRAGKLVFKAYPEEFGIRLGGKAQPQCYTCRDESWKKDE